ncbi:pentatricopeptide repeat-containing protein At5g42310, chloroplastic isoform X2 [Capsicum annuum]|uniref:pentatricopeptide repeat-containing protein At5g42310, chloroplastic isoform X2 n=1 Tax=Capsicum annuum TaxID=4072 RepID=UPI001FB071F6|nr:pentatricopeptide repeat-containing protein At5g42310, chloroplastic isoform X2 [Capsicum annuum]
MIALSFAPTFTWWRRRRGMNSLLLLPLLQMRYQSIQFRLQTSIRRQIHHRQQPLAASSSLMSISKQFNMDNLEEEDDAASHPNQRYDFTPLLQFLSTQLNSQTSSPNSETCSPTQLNPTELRLAESYRAVPAPLWHSLLKSLSSTPSSISIAYGLVTWLQKHNVCFSYELLYSILIHALGRSEKLYEAFLLSQRQTLTPLTYNALIGACARNGDLEKALNLMCRMRRDGYQSDYVNYSLIIQSLIRSNSIDLTMLNKFYYEIEADMIELDGQLLNDMIAGFAKAGDVDRALSFMGVVQGNGLSPKTATIVTLISELGNSGRTEEAEAVFEELKEGGLKPRTRAFNALLKGYVKTGSLKDAEYIVSEMERSGVAPDEHTYSLLIDAYGNAGRWESARIVLKEMEANNVQPNSFVFSRILASYRDRGEWQRSFQVLNEMKNSGVNPDRQFYNIMIDTFGKYNCLDHAMSTFERMKLDEIEPDTVTWNTLIDCHSKHGHHNKAEDLFEAMQESGCFPCTTTYNIMINSFGELEKWEEVKGLLSKMQSQGLLPNIVTYTTLINIYGQSGRFNDAIECLEVMKSAGLKPSSTMYNALINAYAQRDIAYQQSLFCSYLRDSKPWIYSTGHNFQSQ